MDITGELIAERRIEKPGETPEDMTAWQRPITATIDVVNLWAGRITCLLFIPIIGAITAVVRVVSHRGAHGAIALGIHFITHTASINGLLLNIVSSRVGSNLAYFESSSS